MLLAAYAEWGTAMLNRLNGMFAFAVWDSRTSTVLLARDRFGVKPLYYTTAGGRLRFASEIKGLFADDAVPRRANDARVLDFLAYGLADHTPETMFEGIHQVPPGSYLAVRPFEPVPAPVRWYTLRPAAQGSKPLGVRTRELLDKAISLRLRSDVPVGVSLSGGMDSSSVLAVASSLRTAEGVAPPQSFSARSSDPATDEHRYAEQVVTATGSRNSEVLPSFEGLIDELDSIIWHMDEPFHSPSVYGQRKVDELARNAGDCRTARRSGRRRGALGLPPLSLPTAPARAAAPRQARAAGARAGGQTSANRHFVRALREGRRQARRGEAPAA